MRVVHGLTHFKPLNKKPVVALGIFDGLHRGHQRIIAQVLKEARGLSTFSLVVTFFPHPQQEKSLYSLSHRLRLLDETGIDLCLVIRFSPAFRRISAQGFLEKILIKKINPAVAVVGRNFTFGKHAQGNWRLLKDYANRAGFKLKVIDALTYKGRPISSSYIRKLIKKGNFSRAQELLVRPVTVFGRVIGGCRLGRILGYPTANIDPDHEILPPFGVYAVRVRIAHKLFNGICYIGSKPTINPARNKLTGRGSKLTRRANIEVHIFDFKNNLYSCRIQVEFIRKIRSQKRFSSIQGLTRQIKRDIFNCHNNFRL